MQASTVIRRDRLARGNASGLLRDWLIVLPLPLLIWTFFPEKLPQWALMWSMAFAIFAGCKWITWSRTSVPKAPVWKHCAYLLAWPGLDAAAFLSPSSDTPAARVAGREWCFAMAKLLIGMLVLVVGPRLASPGYPYLVGWIGMIGIVLVLHFGLFHLLSCAWRTLGVHAQPLMNWPLASINISEFWGRRWNAAFRDLTHRFVFRPLIPRWGARWSLLAVFVLSGLVHELVITVPARGGYGGPTLFFVIQGLAILASRSSVGQRLGLGSGILGRVFAALVLLGPATLLFSHKFVEEIVLPFLQALGVGG